jgi:RND superfamily putative drug exporter
VLFGLSTDYEVYLVSRIQEEWIHLTRDGERRQPARKERAWCNHEAIAAGQAKSGPVIAAAAVIMILVFGSFLLTGQRVLAEFGFGLGFSVLVDALIIRSLLIPAVMHIVGPANWPLPAWLDRILPNLSIEAAGAPAVGAPPASTPEHPATAAP